MKSLALFDFDGTLTKKDSFLEILKFYRGNVRFILGMMVLSPFLVGLKLGIYPNYKAKEKVLRWFFRGIGIERFQKICDTYADEKLPGIIREEALNKLKYHLSEGHRVVVVSASAENWLSLWCRKNNTELIGTRLEISKGEITGRIDGMNCYGKEKVNRITKYLDISSYETIYAYGDSKGDKEMLEFATHPFFRRF